MQQMEKALFEYKTVKIAYEIKQALYNRNNETNELTYSEQKQLAKELVYLHKQLLKTAQAVCVAAESYIVENK